MMNIIFLLILGFFTGFMANRLIKPYLKKKEIPDSPKPVALAVIDPAALESPRQTSELADKIWFEEENSFLFKLNENISLALDRDKIAQILVEQVNGFLNVSSCVLFLFDDSVSRLKPAFALGIKKELLQELSFERGDSISGKVMETKEALLINDLQNNSYYKGMNKEDYLKNSFISVPLFYDSKVIGVLNVANKRSSLPFTDRDFKLLTNVARMASVTFQNFKLHEQIQEDYLKTITTLAIVLDARDPYTKSHSENVTRYSVAIAKKTGYTASELEKIRRAALLHDIGKIGVRDGILLKPGKLTDEEFEQIKMHPVKGEQIVGSLPFLKDVSHLVRSHHERYDGRGYPDGKKGEEIALGSRIMAVADSFDAMTTDRPYRKRLSLEVAKEELLRNKSTQFDPRIVDCFLQILELEPSIAT
ncbi:MAG: HD domain-containing protein [Candidatus Omnitrophica bacterium]|nr:HD domain-containing protein [Candidatus Omnitrophota bacterium]